MSVPVLTAAQMRDWEQSTWADGRTEADVIRKVGAAVARRAMQLANSGSRILILAGKGHNGDDAKAAQTFLRDREVEWIEVLSPGSDLEKLKTALTRRPALIIDGLFGLGLNRPLSPEWIVFLNSINEAHLPV